MHEPHTKSSTRQQNQVENYKKKSIKNSETKHLCSTHLSQLGGKFCVTFRQSLTKNVTEEGITICNDGHGIMYTHVCSKTVTYEIVNVEPQTSV